MHISQIHNLPNPIPDDLSLTVQQLAILEQCDERTIKAILESGRCHYHTIGKKHRIVYRVVWKHWVKYRDSSIEKILGEGE